MDRIFMTALTAEAIIGIYDWEREVKQRLEVDLEIWKDLRAEASRFRLVEALAGEIARIVLEEFKVVRVRVTVHKPGAIRHSRDVGVVIERGLDG